MTPNTLVETKVPSIPEPTPVNTLETLKRIKELIEVREGLLGDPLDQVVTYRELYALGKLDVSALNGKRMVRLPGLDGISFLPAPRSADAPEFSPPPAVTGLQATGALANVIITFNQPQYHNHAYTEIWRSGTDDLGAAVRVGTTASSVYADNLGQTGATRYYWARNVSQTNVAGPFNATAGTSATTGLINTGDVTLGSITTELLTDGSVVTAKLGDSSVTTIKIGNDQITTAKIADAQVTTSKIGDSQVTTVKINDAAIISDKLADGSVSVTKHASGLRPVEIVSSLGAAGTQGRTVFLTTDNKLYRDTGGAWTAAVPATDLTGQITTTQITDDAITTPKLAAGAVTAAKITAGTITTNEIAADTITSGNIQAGAITTLELAANAVTAEKLSIQTHGVSGLTLTNNSPVAGSVSWSAFTLSWNGNTYSIGSGNTANECIWFDRSLSTTVLQGDTRTTFEANYDSGDGDILIALNNGGTAETTYNATLITGGLIKTGAIVASKIAAEAVVAGKIAANAIVAGDGVIANAAIATAQIQDAAIINAKIGALAVDSAKIADASIVTAKIADLAVTTAKIADATITTAKIGTAQITTALIASAAITTALIADANVTTAKIAALAVTNAEIANLTITGGKLVANTIDASKLNVQEHAVNGLTFTNNSPSAGFVAWPSHTIAWNGNTYSIGSGNSNAEMVWLDRSASTTALQGSSRASFESAFNPADGDILLAVNNSGTAEVVFNSTFIQGGNIKTGSITASKISVSQLSAITADLGAITAGSIVLPSGGFIRSGQTAFDTGTGFYIGNDSGTPKMSLGSSTKGILWDGSAFTVRGDVIATGNIQANGISNTQTTYNSGSVDVGTGGGDLATVSITTTGGPVLIHATCRAWGVINNYNLMVDRDSTEIYTTKHVSGPTTYFLADFQGTLAFVDIPSAGTYTYKFRAITGTGTNNFAQRFISVTELKR